MSEERDYKEDCKLNRFKLEIATEEQGELYRHWAEMEGEAKTSVDKADDFVKLTEAEVEMDIREKALNNKGNLPNGVKATADAIKAELLISSKVKKSKKELIKAKEDLGIYKAARGGMEHRKSTIENLVKLWCAGYWADPNRPKTNTDDMSNNARNKLNNKGE